MEPLSTTSVHSKAFMLCVKWRLDPSEYELAANHTLIQITTSDHPNLTYPSTDYEIRDDGGAWVCAPPELYVAGVDLDAMAIVAWVTSIVFLLLAILLYPWILSSSQHDVKPLICHMASMVVFYSTFVVFQFLPHPTFTTCYVLCWIVYLSFRATFCWLNVIIFDMMLHFRSQTFYRPVVNSTRKFFFQCLYGWGVPFIIFGGSIAVKFISNHPIKNRDHARCLLAVYDEYTQVTVAFVTLSIIVLLNVLFFVILVINLCRIGGEVAFANRKIRLSLCRVYLKMLVLSSGLWLWTVVEWAVFSTGEHHIVRSVSEVVNGLQGLAVFLIFTCNTSALRRLFVMCTTYRKSTVIRDSVGPRQYQYWENHV